MAFTYELIATSTVGAGGASSITFSSIPATYTDLVIKYSMRSSRAANVDNVQLNINGQGVNTNISCRYFLGDGSATARSTTDAVAAGGAINGANMVANGFTNGEIYIPNYTTSNPKVMGVNVVTGNTATYSLQLIVATLWNQTAVINSIALDPQVGDLVQYSTASLYGITKGSGGATIS